MIRTFLIRSAFFICLLATFSCNNSSIENLPEESGAFWTVVAHNAGEIHEDQNPSYLPLPTVAGHIKGSKSKDTQVFLLSSPQGYLSEIASYPIGSMVLKENGEELRYIVAMPYDSTIQNVPIRNFNDFVTRYYSIKEILEIWSLNQCGLGCRSLDGWQDEQSTQLFIERLTNK